MSLESCITSKRRELCQMVSTASFRQWGSPNQDEQGGDTQTSDERRATEIRLAQQRRESLTWRWVGAEAGSWEEALQKDGQEWS